MAEGIANSIGKDVLKAYSAGSKPSGKVNPEAIRVMDEENIDISTQRSKGFGDLPTEEFDIVITLGCKDTCPLVIAPDHREWTINDPKGKDIDFFRRTRDHIKENVWNLVRELSETESFID